MWANQKSSLIVTREVPSHKIWHRRCLGRSGDSVPLCSDQVRACMYDQVESKISMLIIEAPRVALVRLWAGVTGQCVPWRTIKRNGWV